MINLYVFLLVFSWLLSSILKRVKSRTQLNKLLHEISYNGYVSLKKRNLDFKFLQEIAVGGYDAIIHSRRTGSQVVGFLSFSNKLNQLARLVRPCKAFSNSRSDKEKDTYSHLYIYQLVRCTLLLVYTYFSIQRIANIQEEATYHSLGWKNVDDFLRPSSVI